MALSVVKWKTLGFGLGINGFIKNRVQRENDVSFVLTQSKTETKNNVKTRANGQAVPTPYIGAALFGNNSEKGLVADVQVPHHSFTPGQPVEI